MTFVPGKPKTGGREKGTPNKRTAHLADVLFELDIDPVKAILELLPSLDAKEQVDVYRDLLTYLYPKRKAVEVSVDPEALTYTIDREVDYFKLAEMIKAARG